LEDEENKMALLLDQEMNTGVVVSYWKVSELNINWHNKRSHCVMIGFVNQEAREQGKNYITEERFDWNNWDFPFICDQNNVVQAYIKIKESKLSELGDEMNIWATAIDV
jgi:hypothetical protein